MSEKRYSAAVQTAHDYYDSEDADNFYALVWGGEDIHVGLYDHPQEAIDTASRRSNQVMAELTPGLNADTRVIDLGSGYGGALRYLARHYGCSGVGLNLSARENARARRQNAEQGLAERIEIVRGNFEDVPYADDSFDVVRSQEAFLHSGDRRRVMEEAVRILRPGGILIFTDPMQADDRSNEGLQPILDRLHLESLGSPAFYRDTLEALGLEELKFDQRGDMIAAHYGRVLEVLTDEEPQIAQAVSTAYIERMKRGLQHWVDGGHRGDLTWGIFVFRKP
ncbi:methyltransferase domain-containing protein [Spiribacter roseus]|uniref:methyltransferase domain-containing protein n=1 Tax=Spiribacter roseus TaxID=1855875 RepID=UPI0013304CD3|nr:methyltransferase domain-containing protein [Spiribacter roseus]KAF0283046.1 methyltransferase [Spiribacter roseus]